MNEKWGYIDNSGNLVIEMKFDFAEDFSGGMAFVEIEGVQGYIDKTGEFVWKPKE